MPVVLRAEAIEAGYGALEVLWDVSFAVEDGQCVILFGANGSGKTTLLRALVGLVPVMAGRIELDGVRVERLAPHERVRRGLGYMSELGIFPDLTVHENLEIGARGLSGQQVRRRAQDAYAIFPDLAPRRREVAGRLSGGQRKMLGLAKALMGRPRLLVLDEPSAGLSPRLIKETIAALRHLHGQGLAMLLAEQNISFLELAQHAYVLEGGRVRFSGTVAQLEHNDAVRRAYFGLTGL